MHAHIQERLLNLQAGYPIVEGLMLVSRGGFVMASTFQQEESVARLAAVTRTLFLLCGDVCEYTGRGQMTSVSLTYRRTHGGEDSALSRVAMHPVGDDAMLVMVLHSPTNSTPSHDVERIISFIAHQMTQEGNNL